MHAPPLPVQKGNFTSRAITGILVLAVLLLAGVRAYEYRDARKREQLAAELQAATEIRDAIARYRATVGTEGSRALDFTNIESLLRPLAASKLVDEATARYVLAHQARFAIKTHDGAPTIDARWIFDDSAL